MKIENCKLARSRGEWDIDEAQFEISNFQFSFFNVVRL